MGPEITEEELKKRYEALDDNQKELVRAIAKLPSMISSPPYDNTVMDQWLVLEVREFIEKNYRKLQVAEINHAFNMVATKVLKDERNNIVRIKTYGQKMSIDNVGEVLTAYMNGVFNAKVQTKPKSTAAPDKKEYKPMTPRESYELVVSLCVRNDGVIPNKLFIPMGIVHKHLQEIGAYENWSEEEKAGITKSVKETIDNEAEAKKKGPRLIGEAIDKTDLKSAVAEMCVRKHLQEIGYKKEQQKQ